jgi:hypothetical protein
MESPSNSKSAMGNGPSEIEVNSTLTQRRKSHEKRRRETPFASPDAEHPYDSEWQGWCQD